MLPDAFVTYVPDCSLTSGDVSMRIVYEHMVTVENARFSASAQGYFTAWAICPVCENEHIVGIPIWDVGETHSQRANCAAGHEWRVDARVIE